MGREYQKAIASCDLIEIEKFNKPAVLLRYELCVLP
jgi:hypothetical protein